MLYIQQNLLFLIFYVFSNVLIYYLYPITHSLMKSIDKYSNINPEHKKIYFVSNLIKGTVLGLFTPLAFGILYSYFIHNIWNLCLIKTMAAVYCSLDLVSIFCIHKMQFNTTVHHIMVQVLFIISLLCFDFREDTISNPIVIYAIFSTFAFSVNLYLAVRLILHKNLKLIATFASIVYQFCCTINWSYQCYYLYISNIDVIFKIIYSILILGIISDDIVLIKFLNKNSYLKTN